MVIEVKRANNAPRLSLLVKFTVALFGLFWLLLFFFFFFFFFFLLACFISVLFGLLGLLESFGVFELVDFIELFGESEISDCTSGITTAST